ncbi:MAG: dimethylarginine dimethylaminohydrolase family protein [Longimicrobiales bacterium]
MAQLAITRQVGAGLENCELTHLEREPIDVGLAIMQHDAYEVALHGIGLQLESLPALDALPDSVFIEDTAIVLDEVAIITRPGVVSRRPETPHTTQVLAHYRRLVFIDAPGTIEGGDVLRVGRRLLVGITGRTNQAGVNQLRAIVEPLGYQVEALPVAGALHLKSACTRLTDDTILANPDWIDTSLLGVPRVLCVAGKEPLAANVLALDHRVIVSASFPGTRQLLDKAGFKTIPVDVSELHKAEGGLTCLSLIL